MSLKLPAPEWSIYYPERDNSPGIIINPKRKSLKAFTLIELSIVLVIISLIVAAIILGETMKRGAGMQAIIADEAHYVEAARQFREKFGFPPGDFPTATTNWTAAGTCPNPGNTKPQTATCNGNGDGMIEGDGTGLTNSTSGTYEAYTAWQQLANAGMIEGGYTGSGGPLSGCQSIPGVNVPATRLQGGGMEWMLFNGNFSTASTYVTGGPMTNTSFLAANNYQQYIMVGAAPTGTGCNLQAPLLTSSEAYKLDVKIDDGMPGTGTLTSVTSTYDAAACTNGTNAITAGYTGSSLLSTTAQCILLFQVNF